jgi:PAS domain S-box-containing protein
MDYQKKSKEELIKLVKSKDLLLKSLQTEQEDGEQLKFAWTGNLGHWYWDVQNNKVTFNSLKATNLGYTKDEIPENCDFQFFTNKLHPDDYEPVMENMRNHLIGKTNVYEVEYRIKTKKGEWKWYYDRGKITKRTETGTPILLAGIVFDISERKNLEEKQSILINSLSEQLQMQENLFSVIFHDLKTPLSNVIGFTDLLTDSLKESPNQNDEVDEFTLAIAQSAQKAFDITNELLDWIKAKSFNSGVTDKINLASTINHLIDEFEQELKLKNVQIVNQITTETEIHTNKTLLNIALRNFLSNAIKFSHKDAEVHVSYSNKTLSVKDFGVGMDQEKLNAISDRIIDSSPGTAGENGNGIGLILVHKLLEKKNIQFSIESSPNQGTEIKIRFGEG